MDESTIRERIATKIFPESKRGIMLCGINWGDGAGAVSGVLKVV